MMRLDLERQMMVSITDEYFATPNTQMSLEVSNVFLAKKKETSKSPLFANQMPMYGM